jgi:hypothetical protein
MIWSMYTEVTVPLVCTYDSEVDARRAEERGLDRVPALVAGPVGIRAARARAHLPSSLPEALRRR